MTTTAVAVCGLTICALPAVAQTVDDVRSMEDNDAAKSHLWRSALDPQRTPYEQLVDAGSRQLQRRTKAAAQLAIEALDNAFALMPHDNRAYAIRGQAHLILESWPECATDLAKALTPSPSGARDRDQLTVDLGICQGRADQLLEAEQTLTQATSHAPRSEPWLRLGEVRIALGKLDAAIEALEFALEKPDAFRPYIEWLVAIAHDRAGRPSDAESHAARALAYDSTFNSLVAPRFPWLQVGDRDYALALAHRASGAPEYALGHYRHFIAVAPQSPWRHRVEQHIRELSTLEFPQWLQSDPTSSATVDLAAIRPLIRRAMPAMRACAATQPATVFTVALTRNGPRTPTSARDRPRDAMPAPGSQATPTLEGESLPSDERTNAAEVAARNSASRCLERVADRIPLPAPRERDAWYRIWFAVVAPYGLVNPLGT